MIREAGLYDKIGQAFAALDPSRAVGVMGDKRVYGQYYLSSTHILLQLLVLFLQLYLQEYYT
jgi:GMP synthase PP-ATPase subunit